MILIFSILFLTACNAEEKKTNESGAEEIVTENNEAEKIMFKKEDYSDRSWSLEDVCIPDAETAVKVAEVYLKVVFDEKTVDMQKPLNVDLDEKSEIWFVYGTVESMGGDIYIALNIKDGKVLHIGIGE